MKLQTGATVVVPTLNRGAYLFDCLSDLLAQRFRPLEILIVDQSSECPADVSELVARHPEVIQHHRVSFTGLLRARNYGWQNASHECVIYVDDDIRCGPEFVAEHASTLAELRVGAVAGGIDEDVRYIPDQLRRTRGFRRWSGSPVGAYADRGLYDVDAVKGCNFSVRRSLVAELGGFDERLNVGAALYEDLEFCLRLRGAGHRIRFNGAARLQHLAAPSGGCRVPKPREYVESMAHNRALLMARHLTWPERSGALLRLGWLIAAYGRANRDPGIVVSGVRGLLRGFPEGREAPICGSRERTGAPG